jgi:peptidoglycan/LPS O-acetylase OafA/YrhL
MLKNKVKRLIGPYFIYGALWLVPLYTFFDIPTMGRPLHTDFVSGFLAMCMGLFTDHLWFLLPLFWATLFFIIIRNLLDGKKLIVASALSVIAAVCVELFLADIHYYCIAESGPFFIVFFVGILLYHFNEKIEKWNSKIYCIISLALFAVLVLIIYLNIHNTVVFYIRDISGALLFYFIFMAVSRTSSSDKLNQSRFYNFCESRSMNIYLLNCPFMQIYFLLLNPLIGTNVYLTILCLWILSYPSIFIAVWIQNKLKMALVNKIPIQKIGG